MLIKESHTDVQITVDGKETTMSEREHLFRKRKQISS